MIQVVMDTSVFLHDPYRKRASTQTLESLAERDVVTLHLPNIVEREMRSNLLKKLERNFEENLSYLHKAAERLAQDAIYLGHQDSYKLKRTLEAARKDMEALRAELTVRTDSSFEAWLKRLQVERYPFAPEHATKVFESYFADDAPFDVAKQKGSKEKREHIPDAFILEAVRELAKDVDIDEVHVLCADNNLSACCAAVPKAKVYGSVETFLQEGPCLKYLIENDEYIFFNLDRIQNGLVTRTELIFSALKDELEDQMKFLRRRDVINYPANYEELGVQQIRSAEMELEYETPRIYWSNRLTARVEITMECEVQYFDDRDEDDTQHWDERRFKLRATLQVEFPSIEHTTLEMTEDSLDRLLKQANYSLESHGLLELLN